MNKYCLEQMNKVKVSVPSFDENTTHIVIPCSIKSEGFTNDLQVGIMYKMRLADYVVNEPEGFTLSKDWNFGKKPPCHEIIMKVVKLKGKMVQVESGLFSGWLPLKSIEEWEAI